MAIDLSLLDANELPQPSHQAVRPVTIIVQPAADTGITRYR